MAFGDIKYLFFGEALSSAMNSLITGIEFARNIAQSVDKGLELGSKILQESTAAIVELLDAYNKTDGHNLLRAQGVDVDKLKPYLDELAVLVAGLPKDKNVPNYQELVDAAEPRFKELLGNIFSVFQVSPVYNSDEWDAYEIEPPTNPVFKPKKVLQIPDNMELFEIACPAGFRGPAPMPNDCGNPCATKVPCKPCKKPLKKKRKCKKRVTKSKPKCSTCPAPVYSSSYYPRRSYY